MSACPASAYQSIITDGYAWQDYRAAPDPDIAPYVDWAAKLQPGGPPSCIAWVIGREDLNPWADLRLVLNRNLHDVEDNALKCRNTPARSLMRPRHPEADATAQAEFLQLLDCN